MKVLLIIVIIALCYLIFRTVLFYFLWRYVFTNKEKGNENPLNVPKTPQYEAVKGSILELINRLVEYEFEPVEITSFDGLKLYGRLFKGSPEKPVLICFHGYKSPAMRDAGLSADLTKKFGFNVIVIDERGQGKSGGRTISFGALERKDVISWCNYAISRFGEDTRIGLCGLSMGAATVLLASGMNELPSNVKGVVADCPYSSGRDIIRTVIKGLNAPVGISYLGVSHAGETYGHFRMKDTNVVEAVKKCKIPILLIHGDSDLFVPCEMSQLIYEANPSLIDYQIYKGAGHGLSFIIDEKRYISDILRFWQKVFCIELC